MGGGGGGSSFFEGRTPEQMRAMLREAEAKAASTEFETKLAGVFATVLGEANSRDTRLVNDRLDAIKRTLEGVLEGSVDSLYGGSVAKHTYIEGLSDVDSLLLLNDSELRNARPKEALEKLTRILRERLPEALDVSHGRVAVTVRYRDGMEIQVLPAIGTDGGVKVPAWRADQWSEIDPKAFATALTKANERCGGKLVPTIKLAKRALAAALPESEQLTGYHVESLAIAAFKDYTGPRTTTKMLPHFFDLAKDLVLSPIRDSSGQSVHVDEYLGPADSPPRRQAAHLLGRLARRMLNASGAQSVAQWKEILGE